ncbi:GldG family protein [Ruminococcus sp. NK3A76]|uniref:GldG family protein n=1 Tax=Ruminococcus sp. NK3A76 TaxID=877411 RepID=UPI00048D25E8|nr:GldG family protein [Ruminococcus sp. NK3A76]
MAKLDENKVSTDSKDLLAGVLAEEKKKKAETGGKKEDKPEKTKKNKGESGSVKKLKHGAMATTLTVVFFVFLVLVNIVATKLFERYPITIDLTKEKIYSISEDSEDYIKSIDMDVMITVCADEKAFSGLSTYTQQANEVMKSYSKYNSKIKYQYKDINANPDFYKDYTDEVAQYDIIVETNPKGDDGKEIKRTRVIGLIDLVQFNDELTQMFSQYGVSVEEYAKQVGNDLTFISYYGNYIESSSAEQAFTSAIMAVTDPSPVTVTFLEGRNELSEFSYFRTLLTANGYTVKSINITTDDIPEDSNVLVMGAPKVDYLPEELDKVDKFLLNDGILGRQLIYVSDYGQSDTPNIDEFLKEYGLEIGKGVVCETYQSNYYQKNYYTIANEISDDFRQDMTNSNPELLVLSSRPVNPLYEEDGMIKTFKYVSSSKDAYTMDTQTEETLTKGQQNYIVLASKAAFGVDNDDTYYSNILAIGGASIISDQVLAYDQYQNREYILSVINGLTGKTKGITVTPKVISGNIFDINEGQKTKLKWTFIVIIPVIVLITGLVIWIRRKNK